MTRKYVIKRPQAQADLKIDYERELNPQQFQAVTATPGPALVIAGAGSGKTRTLTYRVAWLIEQGVPPDHILLLTFTNKAAREMMTRAAELTGAGFSGIWGGTFHSVGARILRRHAEAVGLRPDFTIMDRDDAVQLVKTCLGAEHIDVKSMRLPKAEVLADIFSTAANTRQPIARVVNADYGLGPPALKEIEKACAAYEQRKRAANTVDFDDLLTLWLNLLLQNAEVCEKYQRQFLFILVDEYQDTNKLQCELIDLLAQRNPNLMVVGDDSQSIYAWRGAEYRNILEFPQRYPAARIYKIETNYRSTPEILAVANAAIAANEKQYRKELTPARKPGTKPALVQCLDANQQAGFVAHRVLELREEGVSPAKMAVLYRSHFHAMELQLELTKRDIPFAITSGIRVFEQAHIKDVIAYLRLVFNPLDELSFKRLALMLPGIGNKAAEKLWLEYRRHVARGLEQPAAGNSDSDSNSAPGQGVRPSPAMNACNGLVPKKGTRDWKQLVETLEQIESSEARKRPASMIKVVMEAGYVDYLKETYPNYRSRTEDLELLAGYAEQFNSLEELLTQLSLLTNLEAEGTSGQARRDENERIRLSTIHQAKGLEWDIVFVIMLCDKMFPSFRSLESPDGEEEERRLFYVAITRARDELYLIYPNMRFAQGYSGDVYQIPSRFLKEIPSRLLEEWELSDY